MALLDDLGAALAPAVLGLAGDFGATLTLYNRTQGTAADGSTTTTYTVDPVPVTGFVRMLSAGARDKLFGARSEAVAALVVPRQSYGLPILAHREGVAITSGVYAGTKWITEGAGVPDPAGLTVTVPLLQAPAGAF